VSAAVQTVRVRCGPVASDRLTPGPLLALMRGFKALAYRPA